MLAMLNAMALVVVTDRSNGSKSNINSSRPVLNIVIAE